MSQNSILKAAAAVIVLIAAITRIVINDDISTAIDETTLLFVVVAFMIIVIPWDRLKSFKAGGFEVDISQLKDTQRRLENVTEDVAGLVNRVEQALIPIIGGKNPHQVERLQKEKISSW